MNRLERHLVLQVMTRLQLVEVAKRMGLPGAARLRLDELRETLRDISPSPTASSLLGHLSGEQLDMCCRHFRLPTGGTRSAHITRLTEHAQMAGDEPDVDGSVGELTFEYDEQDALRPPRPYQADLVRSLRRDTKPGGKYLVHLATGGGKTRVANDWLMHDLLASGKKVLWVAKDWELLRQAAGDICRRHPDAPNWIGWVGGQQFPVGAKDGIGRPLLYTTLHTWGRRKDTDFFGQKYDCVIIDEAHWGEEKKLHRSLVTRYSRGGARIVGLTATPRQYTKFEKLKPDLGFAELVKMEVLARPVVTTIATHVDWRPDLAHDGADFDSDSLNRLGRLDLRNKLIVQTWVNGDYGKTIVFACDIAHATNLARAFRESGVSAEAVHYDLTPDERREALRKFRTSMTRVLVNVAMLTHGVDIPDIETVFLARPTASDILFAQMVGRASRRTEEKSVFHIVDFVDNLAQHRELLVGPAGAFRGVSFAGNAGGKPRGPALAQHTYGRASFLHFPRRPRYEPLSGLDFHTEQTFGIEFEFTRPTFETGKKPRDWNQVAKSVLDALRAAGVRTGHAPISDYGGAKDNTRWNVEYDSSCGWELTSRILRGAEGFEEVADVLTALEPLAAQHRFGVDRRTGTHIHLGWRPDAERLRGLMEFVAEFEPALLSLVAPSRAKNPYCKLVRPMLPQIRGLRTMEDWNQHFADHHMRYVSINPKNLFGGSRGYGTLEVRLHSGTLEAPKILTWISLWMRILDAVDRRPSLGRVPSTLDTAGGLSPGADGDVRVLVKRVTGSPTLDQRLRERRRQVVSKSWLLDEAADIARTCLRQWEQGSGHPPELPPEA